MVLHYNLCCYYSHHYILQEIVFPQKTDGIVVPCITEKWPHGYLNNTMKHRTAPLSPRPSLPPTRLKFVRSRTTRTRNPCGVGFKGRGTRSFWRENATAAPSPRITTITVAVHKGRRKYYAQRNEKIVNCAQYISCIHFYMYFIEIHRFQLRSAAETIF